MDFVGFIGKIIVQTPRILLGLFIASALILGITYTLLGGASLSEFYARDPLLTWVYGVFIISPSLLVSYVITKCGLPHWVAWRERVYGKKVLGCLTSEERDILSKYINKNISTDSFSTKSGSHKRLEMYGILYRSSTTPNPGMVYDYNISQWAKEYLNKRPELLKISNQSLKRT